MFQVTLTPPPSQPPPGHVCSFKIYDSLGFFKKEARQEEKKAFLIIGSFH